MSNSWCNLSLGVDENPRVNMAISGANYNQPYELPTMSTTLKGGAKVGEGLAIDENEQLNIEDGAITPAKLDNGAVTTNKLSDGAVTVAKLNASVLNMIDNFPTVGNGLQLANDNLSVKLGAGLEFDGNGYTIIDGSIATVSELSAEADTRANADDVLNARIDTIIAGYDDDPNKDSELVDIRTGENGIVYASAGDAVRGQVSDIKDDIDVAQEAVFDIEEMTPYQTTASYKLNAAGLAIYDASYELVKYAVNAGSAYHLELSADSAGVYLFQDNHTSVPGQSAGTNTYLVGEVGTTATDKTVIAPSGAYYLITSKLKTNNTNSVKSYKKLIDSDEYSQIVCGKNMIGTDKSIYYPVKELHTGDVLTFSTSDGQGSAKSVAIYFFDKNKTQLGYWSLGTGNRTRTVTLPAKLNGTRYLKLGVDTSSQPVQVEMGGTATTYEPYYGNTKFLYENALAATPETISSQSFNAAFHVGATDFSVKCTEFSSLMYGDAIADVTAPSDCESFLFFTDPHLCEFSEWQNRCQEYIAQIQKYYNSTPTTFCLCGGDWLGNSDLPATACFKLGYIDGFMHSMFDNCYMLVGNHDTNYQGKLTPESSTYTTRLSNQSIVDLWYRGGKAYYEFHGANTRFFCFDTGIENQQIGSYGYEQAEWFANKLLTNTDSHIALAVHILYYNLANLYVQPLTQTLLDIAQAFNNRSTITVNGNSYNFSNCSGTIEFLISGHTHEDGNAVINGIPCIVTANVRHDESVGPTFDLILVNYSDSVINMVRVGDGNNRTVNLA